MGQTEASMLLEGYLHNIATIAGACLWSPSLTLQGSTLLLYFKAASLWLHTELHLDVPMVCPTTQKIVQPFCNSIAQAFKWGTPQPKCKPYTHQMIATFYCQACALIKTDPWNNLTCFLAVFDWIHLGLFTGSHGIEYCQAIAHCHTMSQVLQDGIAGSCMGELVPFIMTNFWFLTSDDMLISPVDGLHNPSCQTSNLFQIWQEPHKWSVVQVLAHWAWLSLPCTCRPLHHPMHHSPPGPQLWPLGHLCMDAGWQILLHVHLSSVYRSYHHAGPSHHSSSRPLTLSLAIWLSVLHRLSLQPSHGIHGTEQG